MQINRLTPDLAAGPQIAPVDVETLAALGYRSIIGNRPDGEAPDQPTFASVEAAAREHGLETCHIPVVASQIDDQDIGTFGQALLDLPKPIFAFCRTGTRSTLLWALANNDQLTTEERLRLAAAHGYDISGFRAKLEAADEGPSDHA